MTSSIASDNGIILTVSIVLISMSPTASAQSNCVCPETSGVSIGVLVGACLAVLGGTILLELVGYLAYQKWKKKRIKDGSEPVVVYSPSTAINIDENDVVVPVDAVRNKERRSGSDSGRSSVYNISETQSMRSFFGDSVHDSRRNSIIDVANDFEPLTDTYRVDWKNATDGDLHDDYDVLERAFPILLPKLDAVDFTSARYKSTKINIIPQEPQEVVVGVAVEGDRTSRSSSSTRVYKTATSHSSRSRQSSAHRQEERSGRWHGHRSLGRSSSEAAVEIEPDRPPVTRHGRIEIDENFSIASSRRSESSDEDLYDHGDEDGRQGMQGKSGSSHGGNEGGQRVKRAEKREALRRQVIEKRGASLEGSAAMKASGARRAKSLVEGEKTRSRTTHQARSSSKAGTSRGKDYHMVKREVVDGKEVVTLVRAEPSSSSSASRDHGRSATTGTSELARSYSEMDPRQRVSFRDPLESLDEQSIPTIGVIHLVDSLDEGSSSDISYRRAPRGRATDRFQKKRTKRSRSESPIRYSERKEEESRKSQQSTTPSFERSSHQSRATISSDRHSRTTDGRSADVPTIGIVRLVSSSPNLDHNIEGSTWPRSMDKRSLQAGSVSHRRTDETSARVRTERKDRSQSRRTVDVSTQCEGPKTRTVAVEPRVSWKRLLDEMEIILKSESESMKHRTVGGKMRSTLSRLSNTKKERSERSQRDNRRRHSLERDGYKDEVTWEELLRDVEEVDDKLESDSKKRSRSGPKAQTASGSHTSKEATRAARSSSRKEDAHHRSRSMSPVRHYSQTDRGRTPTRNTSTTTDIAWDDLVETVRETVRDEERRGRSTFRRPRDETDHPRRQVSRGTQPDVSWGTLLRLMESRMEEKMNTERRYKKRTAPIVGKFSLKADKRPKALVSDMGTSPELSWGDFIEIATAEAERNMKSRSVPDLRVAEGPQNIGKFSLKENKQPSVPVRSTATETDLSYNDLVDIILEELNLIDSERSSSRRSASYDRERILDRTKSLGVVHVRSKSEERPRGRDSGTQPDLSWTQVIDIVKEETRRMILKQKRENAMDMGTEPIIPWNELIETILEESDDFWRQRRKQMVDKGTKPSRSWSKIVQIIQEEMEEVLRLRTLNNMDSKGTQTESDSSSVAVSTLRTWVRDRPRRVQWAEGTEPQTEWESLVREIEATAVSDYIKANGLDHPREAPVVSVIKLKKDEQPKVGTANSSTSPMVDWKSFVTEIQEDAIEQTRKIIKKERDQQQRIPVAGVFKLKQEEQPTTKLLNSGTNPEETWTDIITELREEYENEYRRTIRELQHKVVELEEIPKSFSVVNTGTQPELSWDVIVNRIQEEAEETIIRHQRIKQQEQLSLMLERSAQTTLETGDASSQVAVMVHDKSSETWQQINQVGLQVQSKTSEAAMSFVQPSKDTGIGALVSRVESVGTACAPNTTDRHVTVTEQEKEVKSSGTQISPSSVSFGTVTDQVERSSTLSQCQVEVNVASVAVSQETADQIQQTSPGTSEQSLMTEEVAKDVREHGLQVTSEILTQSSQTVKVITHDSSAMTDAVGTKEESTLAVQEETVVVVQEETTSDKPDPNIDTYETWTYVDDYKEEEEEPVLTSVFTHQFEGAQTHERSTLAMSETRTINTETECAKLETKHTQVLIENESKGVSHAPETLLMSTQTNEIITRAPLMVEKGNQQIQETSQFSQNTITLQNDRGSQASPEERIYLHQASLAKPFTRTMSTECDTQSDIDSGIDMDCQTPPVMVFSLDEYQQIERDIYEYQEMKKNIETMEEEIRQYKDTQKVINRLETEVIEYERLKENVVEMENKIAEYQEMQKNMAVLEEEIYEYQQRQRGMEELQERLKEFEEQEILERVDAGIVTDILSSENHGTQTCDVTVRALSSQTEIAVADRSTSPVRIMVNDILSQTDSRMLRDIFTEVDVIGNHNQSTQVTSDARDYGMVTDKTEIRSVALQATVTSHDTHTQYERSEDDMGIQANVAVTKSSQACQVTAHTSNSSTSTEILETNSTFTQSSADVRENGAQSETGETDTGTQTVPKQTTDVSTEVEAKVVRIEKHEKHTASQTEQVPVENRMLDPIMRLISEAQIQVDQPPINLSFKVTQTVENQLTTSAAQTEEVEADVSDAVTSPHNDVSYLVIQTEDLVTQSTSLQHDILSTTSITQTEDRPIESRVTQTEEMRQDTKNATTSWHPESANFLVQTESVVTESTSTQHDIGVFSSLTQTEVGERVAAEEKSTSIDVIQKISSEQTDEVPTDTRSVQYEAEWTNIETQTEIVSTSDATSNTVSREIIDNSAQTHNEEVTTQVSQVQFSAPATFGNTQTEVISMRDSSCETEEKVLTDQITETEEVTSSDVGSQVTSIMSDQQSQSEVPTRSLEVQTDVVSHKDADTSPRSPISTDDSSTQYEGSVRSDKETQYQASADHYVLQTEEIRLASIQMNTDPAPSSYSATQTELKTKPMDDSSTQCEKNVSSDMGTQYQASADHKAFQTLLSRNEFGMICDLAEIVVEKEEETVEASAPVTTSLFQGQFDEEKTPQEDIGTTCKPSTTTAGQQVHPDTAIFGTSVAHRTRDTGMHVDNRNQSDIGSQMTPISDEKYTEAKSSLMQRAVSPITTTAVTASTQIDTSPVPTTTLQIQVEDEAVTKTADITEEVVLLSDVVTQTHESSLNTMTQTRVRETRHAGVASHQLERKVHKSMEALPVRNTRATATFNSVKKEMGTQHITREYEKKMHRRRDVTLTSTGTYTDVATRTSSMTQTIITPRAQSGVQMVPTISSVGVFSNIKPSTAIEGVNTPPTDVRSVLVQKDTPQMTSKPSQKDPTPSTSRAISPNTLEKLEDDIIDDMRTKLTIQIREEVETEYVSEILPILVEQVLREKVEREQRSRPKSRDAVTSPLRGRSMERSSQHSEQWPFTSTDAPESRKLGEREKHILRENTKKELRNELKPEIRIEVAKEIRKEVEKEVRENVARDVEQEIRRQVARDVEQSVREQVAGKVKNDIIREMKTDMRVSVKREVAAEVRDDVKKEIADRIQAEVKEDLMREYRTDVFTQEEHKMTEEITTNVKEKLKPQLREEIEKELREDITRELKFENLKLVTSQSRVLVDKDTSTPATKSTTLATQVDPKTNNQGFQVDETKPELSEKISQNQPVVLERGTITQKRPLTDFTTQIEPNVSDTGTNPTVQVFTKTFSAQMEQPTIEQKHHSDQYVYMPTKINEATQSAVWNVTSDSVVQAVPKKDDKSVFGSLMFPSISSKLQDLPERKHQETQIHRVLRKSTEIQVSRDASNTSASMQFQPDTKHASLGTTAAIKHTYTQEAKPVKDTPIQKYPIGTYKDRATSPERAATNTSDESVQMAPATRNGSVSPVPLPIEERTRRSIKSAEMQTLSESYTLSSMQIHPDTKHASTGAKAATQQVTSTGLQATRSVRDVPIQMGSNATHKDRSTSPERSVPNTSIRAMQLIPTVRDGAVSPVMLPSKGPTQRMTKLPQMQTSSSKSFASSSTQFQPETNHASVGSKSAVQYTSTGLQATRSVREVPIQMGSNATFKDRSTSPERATTHTSSRSLQFEPSVRDGSISPVMLPLQENQRSVGSAAVQTPTDKNYASSSMQSQLETKHVSVSSESAVRHTSTGLQAIRSVREVPIQTGSQGSFKDRSTSPRRAVTNSSHRASQFGTTVRDGSISPIMLPVQENQQKVERSTEVHTHTLTERTNISSSMQFQPETKHAVIGPTSAVQHISAGSQVTQSVREVPIQMSSGSNYRDSATSPQRSVSDVPIQIDPRATKDSSTDPDRVVTSTSSKSSQFYPVMQDGSVSPIASRKTAKTAEMQTKDRKYTSSLSQFQPETKTASAYHKATGTDSSSRFVHFKPVMRDGSVSPVAAAVDQVSQKIVKTAEMQTRDKTYISSSSQFQPDSKTASIGYKADAVNTSNRSVQIEKAVRDGSISPVTLPVDHVSPKSIKIAEMQTKDKQYTSASSQIQAQTKTASFGYKADAVNTSSKSMQNQPVMRDGSASPVVSRKTVKAAGMQTKDKKCTSASSQFQPDTKAASVGYKANVTSTSHGSMQFKKIVRDGSSSPVILYVDQGPPKSVKISEIQTEDKQNTSVSSQFQPDTKTVSIGYKADVTSTAFRSQQFKPIMRDGSGSPVTLSVDQGPQKSTKAAEMQTRHKQYTSAYSQFHPDTKNASIGYEADVTNTSSRSMQFEPKMRDGASSPVGKTSRDTKYTSASSQFQPKTMTASVGYKADVIDTSIRSSQFKPPMRDGANSPVILPVDQTSSTTAGIQTSKDMSYTSTSSQFQPLTKTASMDYRAAVTNTSQRSLQFEPTTRDGANSPVALPVDQKSFKTAEIQTFKDRIYTSASSQFQPDTKTISVGYKSVVTDTSQRSVQSKPAMRDGANSPAALPVDQKTVTTAEMQTSKDRIYTSASSQSQPDTKTASIGYKADLPNTSQRSVQSKPTMRDETNSPVEYLSDPKSVMVAQMQTSRDQQYTSASSQFQPDTKTALIGYKADVTNTSQRSVQFEPTTRDGANSPVVSPVDQKSVIATEMQTSKDRSYSSANMQTSRDQQYTSASSQFQPDTKTALIGYKADVTNTSQRSVQFEPTTRDGANSPVVSPVHQKSVRTAEMQTLKDRSYSSANMQTSKYQQYTASSQFQPDTKTASIGYKADVTNTSQKSVQSKPTMRDGTNSPVDQKSVKFAQMQTSRNQQYTSASSQFHPDTKTASVGHSAVVTVSSLLSQPSTTTASFGPRMAVTSDRFVQIEPAVRDENSSPVIQPPVNQTPESPILDQRRTLGTIDEKPVKLSKTTNLQQSSFVRTPQLDEELYNLLKQAEKLGTVRRLPSTSKTITISCVTTTKVTPRVVDAVTTMLQQLPPRCRVVILHQSAPGVTYTTAVLTTTNNNTPAMSTGFHQSRLSSRTSTFPAISGHTRGPMTGESDPELDDDSQKASKGLQRTPSGRVRFADQDKHVEKQQISTYRAYTSKKTSSLERVDPTEVSNSTYGFRKPSPRGITTRLQDLYGESPSDTEQSAPRSYLSLVSKPGIEADVDTGDSETDSEPQLKSILRKPASQFSKGSTLLGKRSDPREDVSTESDESSVCDQYDISRASVVDSSPAKLPSLSSLSRDGGTIKQDLSMSGVIASSKSTTLLTGYRQYDSSKADYRGSKTSSSQYQRSASGAKKQ